MRNYLVHILFLFTPIWAYASKCHIVAQGYNVIDGTTYPFLFGDEQACFFAFYTPNPEPIIDASGNGNQGDSVWFGYYKLSQPGTIYEFPKPDSMYWSSVCSVEAVSFYAMHGNAQRDVTVIGSCNKQNPINYTYPFVFIKKGNKYELDNTYKALYGFVGLTIADIRNYIQSPNTQYIFLRDRYNADK